MRAISREYLESIADEQLIDTDVVVALTGASRSTTYRWEANGVLPRALRLGGSRRWRMGSIRRHIQNLEQQTAVRS